MSDLSWQDGIYRAGATQAAYVEQVAGMHPEIYFRYRVKSPAECDSLIKEIMAKEANGVAIMAREVKAAITSWSLSADVGSELSYSLLKRVFWIIVQTDASSPIPAKFEDPGTLEQQVKKS